MYSKQKNSSGFTLIEMIVSLGVFSMVVTTAVGAMLVLIATNQRLQAEQSVMTNLAFALDTMTREIRTGYNYYCDEQPNLSAGGPFNIFNDSNDHDDIVADDVRDCNGRSTGRNFQGISFVEEGNSITGSSASRILYYFDGINHTIMRRVGNEDSQPIVSEGLFINNAEFYVSGSDNFSLLGDIEQPTVTVYIEAQEKDDPTAKTYYLETTVTQRTLDL